MKQSAESLRQLLDEIEAQRGRTEPGTREAQVLDLLLEGASNQEIANQLGMALRTVKAHMNRLFLRHNITGGIKRVRLAVLIVEQRAKEEK